MNTIRWLLFVFLLCLVDTVFAGVKGIYISQTTLEDTKYFTYLIEKSKASGIDAFIIDMERPSKQTEKNLALFKESHIKYIARIIVFPDGGTEAKIQSRAYWEKKYKLAQYAINLGAEEIQLDYIRYNGKQKPSPENAENVLKVIQWFKNKLLAQNIPLQIDVFGITGYNDEKYIGQNVKLFSSSVDAMCPMVYPSHFFPFKEHSDKPYDTVFNALKNFQKQFAEGRPPFKLYPYIELSNFRFSMSHEQTMNYIVAQIRAAENAGADGFFAWSPNNKYNNLFKVLQARKNAGTKEPIESAQAE